MTHYTYDTLFIYMKVSDGVRGLGLVYNSTPAPRFHAQRDFDGFICNVFKADHKLNGVLRPFLFSWRSPSFTACCRSTPSRSVTCSNPALTRSSSFFRLLEVTMPQSSLSKLTSPCRSSLRLCYDRAVLEHPRRFLSCSL